MLYTANAKDALTALKEAEALIRKNRGGDVTVILPTPPIK